MLDATERQFSIGPVKIADEHHAGVDTTRQSLAARRISSLNSSKSFSVLPSFGLPLWKGMMKSSLQGVVIGLLSWFRGKFVGEFTC